ncbi:unnamed protein product [Aspergillus oryzae]|nr:unnamed protein product [Aspergillus oryzae]
MDQQIASYKFSSNDRQYVPNYPSLPPSLSLTGPHLVIRTGLSVGTRRLLSSSSPKAPCLQLEIELCPLLQYTLRRATPDDDPRPFVFVWSPLNEGYHQDGFILLRHTSDGKLERVSVPDAIQDPIDIVHVKYSFDVQELKPGGSITYYHSLPCRYREQLEPGETYELVWPGTKIRLWRWEFRMTMWDPTWQLIRYSRI